MKIMRTPLLQTLVTYSKNSTTPKKEHVENICRVLQTMPEPEQSCYKNILNMSMNSSTSRSLGSPNKNLSPTLRSKSNKTPIIKPRHSRLIISPKKEEKKAQFKISQKTKTLAINLNKHKLKEEENSLKPKYMTQVLTKTEKNKHRLECDCFISEVKVYASQIQNLYKVFLCCRNAASDLPQLLSNKIHSIISIGEEPNNFPSIRGGYKNVPFEGSYNKLVAPVFAFLISQSVKGNVLVCDESGKGAACVMVMCFFMKYLKINYDEMIKIMKNSRTFFTIGEDEEVFIKTFDQHKIG